jgi:uncharacterized membrane protein YbhN (UPF0104 family)
VGSRRKTKKRTSPRRRWLRYGIEVASVGAVVYFFSRERHEFTGFVGTLSKLNWPWVGIAFAAELASIPPLAETQRIVLRAGGTKAPWWEMNLVTLGSNAISLSVPVGVAFAEGYAYARYRRFGAKAAVAAWSELASGAIAFSGLAGLALAGALIAGGRPLGWLLPLLSVVFAGSVGAAILFRHPHVLVKAFDWVEDRLHGRIGQWICEKTRRARDSLDSLTDIHPSLFRWTAAGLLSGVNWLLDAVCLALSFRAVGGPIPWGAVLLAFAGAKIVTSIGLTPGGLGIIEGGLAATFVAYGTPGKTAAAAILVYRALTLFGLVGIGWLAAAGLEADEHRDRR